MARKPAARRAHPLMRTVREFLQLESTGGLLLVAAAVLAIVLRNSPLAGRYVGVDGARDPQ